MAQGFLKETMLYLSRQRRKELLDHLPPETLAPGTCASYGYIEETSGAILCF
jgi:hypothetical protein